MAEYTHDVFISHSSVDRGWVREQLLPRLEGAGLVVLLADRDFEIGVAKLVNVERAVEKSRHTLIVLTPDWIAGEWNAFESLLVGTTDPAGRRRKLIPLMLKPTELPARIAMLTYADLTTEDHRWQWERLIATLTDGAPPICRGARPCAPTEDQIFVNRDRELDQLNVQRLGASRSPYTLIGAPAGYGKTCLLRQALRLADASEEVRRRWSIRYVEFQPPGDEDDRLDESFAIAEAITGQEARDEPSTAPDQVCAYVVQELATPLPEGRRAVLILLDGVERLAAQTWQWLYELLQRCYRNTRAAGQEIVVVRFVLAGQNVADFWEGYERAHPTPPAPQWIALKSLDAYAIQEWVWRQAQTMHIVLDDRTVRQIADHVGYLSGGHPRVIRGLIDDLGDKLFLIGPATEYYQAQQGRLLREYLAPVADELARGVQDGLREPVLALSAFRRVNANTIQALERAGALPAGTDEVALLGDLQRVRILEEPRIDEPFYRDRLLRRVLALDMAHRTAETHARFRDLNRAALDLYAGWVQDGDRALAESHLKATQRLYAVVEWLYHALLAESIDQDALRAELVAHIAALAPGHDAHVVSGLIADAIERDGEIRYLLCRRLGETGLDMARQWLTSL